MEFNLADTVSVRLTEEGYTFLRDYYNRNGGGYLNVTLQELKKQEDSDGRLEFIFWEFCNIFSKTFAVGSPVLFDFNVRIKSSFIIQ